jgi:hypothetical protein
MFMKFLLILLLPSLTLAQSEIEDAKRSVRSLIQPLMAGASKSQPKGTEKFRVDGCDKKKVDWMGIILMRSSATLDYKFKDGCDIQGTITPKIFQTFPASLKLRNIQSYSQIDSQNKVTANLESKPIMNLEMREGVLSGKKSLVKFEADYKVQMNPTAENPVEKNLGGEIRILEINGTKINIKEKIFID